MDDLLYSEIDILPRKQKMQQFPFLNKPRQTRSFVYRCDGILNSEKIFYDEFQSMALACPNYVRDLIAIMLADASHYDFNVDNELLEEYLDEIFSRGLDYLMLICEKSGTGLFERHFAQEFWRGEMYELSISAMRSVLQNLYHMGVANQSDKNVLAWFNYNRGIFEIKGNHIVYHLQADAA